jgi:ferric iron reductase protein FhuF
LTEKGRAGQHPGLAAREHHGEQALLTAGDVCRAIDRLAVGEFSPFCGRLVGDEDVRPSVSAKALLDADMCKAIEARFAKRFASFDPRAAHSIWMKWYLFGFLPPILLADLFLMRTLPVALEHTRFIIGDDDRVDAVVIRGVGDITEGVDPFDRFEGVIFDHFAPLIERWSIRTGVTCRVFWSNIGNTFEAMLRKVEQVSGASERLVQAQGLLASPTWRGGRPNPLHDAVRYVFKAGIRHRRRRVCCIQYLLPDRRFCSACPVRTDEATAGNLVIMD